MKAVIAREFAQEVENYNRAKRPRDEDVSKELDLVRKERDELRVELTKCQQALATAQSELAQFRQNEPTPEDIAASIRSLRGSLMSQICRSMVWKPSCKAGGARLSVSFPNVTIKQLEGLVGSDRYDHATKGKKSNNENITVLAKTAEEVESILGEVPEAGIRFGYLIVSFEGQGMKFSYNKKSSQLQVSGKYVRA
jgi:hypothetical protein